MATERLIIEQIGLDDIVIPDGRRPIDRNAVESLAASMGSKMGLRTPISLRRIDKIDEETGEDDGEIWVLVSGRHRLEAARMLGWESIPAIFMAGDEIDAEMWELAENLHRADLTVDQRREYLRRYAELVKKRDERGISPHGAAKITEPPKRGRPKELASRVADETGVSKDSVQRALDPVKADADKKKRATLDADIKVRAAKEVANVIAEYVPAEWWDGVKANLYAARSAKIIADELTNISGQSIMDRRHAPSNDDGNIPAFLRRAQ